MNNYITKFYVGQDVRIKEGLHFAQIGVITGYSPGSTRGFVEDCHQKGIKISEGIYTVYVRWFWFFGESHNVLERSLEAV